MYWVIGFVVSLAGLSVYLELGSYFPSRSGAEVVYLEQAYPRPKYFFPVAFAVQSVILSFSSSNAIGNSPHLFADNDPVELTHSQCWLNTCSAWLGETQPRGSKEALPSQVTLQQ